MLHHDCSRVVYRAGQVWGGVDLCTADLHRLGVSCRRRSTGQLRTVLCSVSHPVTALRGTQSLLANTGRVIDQSDAYIVIRYAKGNVTVFAVCTSPRCALAVPVALPLRGRARRPPAPCCSVCDV